MAKALPETEMLALSHQSRASAVSHLKIRLQLHSLIDLG
jgi:hypothetical protein